MRGSRQISASRRRQFLGALLVHYNLQMRLSATSPRFAFNSLAQILKFPGAFLVHYNSENVNAVRDKSCKINARFPRSFVRRLGKPAPFLIPVIVARCPERTKRHERHANTFDDHGACRSLFSPNAVSGLPGLSEPDVPGIMMAQKKQRLECQSH